ncbi:hypothetical protein EIN_316970 [Entamoeba invadens IP1]|uniref:TLDc domain-containing protein n=1 Tax=Entamoeba invadens IP1 TaxID=370355 RepID=A0A0A1U2S8_ENTIV|nr:hypothetical protein EIN_316970 [Entamoeba invadens IP1]ELP86968.1 hypothetical protein EIN_316970 [Entamoeba invadens IP1]|eukprot:XP_004253739.1 hypothetical protein EIN_316970 [Entamoeba invadens IP1]
MGGTHSDMILRRSSPRCGSMTSNPEYFITTPLESIVESRYIIPKISKRHSTNSTSNDTQEDGTSSSSDSPREGKRSVSETRKGMSPFIKLTQRKRRNKVSLDESFSASLKVDDSLKEQNILYNNLLLKTETSKMEILFDSNVDGFDERALKSAICCKDKLVFLFKSGNESFGFYNSDMVPVASGEETLQVDSKTMFLFSFKNDGKTPEIFNKKSKSMKSFSVFSGSNPIILSCFSSFWMEKSGIVSFNPCVKQMFLMNKKAFNPFFGMSLNEKWICKHFLVFRCLN